jgi:hypothetical protein
VRGAQRAGRRVADRGAMQPRDLAALGAVRAAGARRQPALRAAVQPRQPHADHSPAGRGHAPPGLVGRLPRPRARQPVHARRRRLNRTSLYGDLINPLAQNLAQQNQRLTREGTRLGAEVGQSLRGASSDVRAGRGSVGAVTPGFLRGPTAAALGLAAPLGAAIPRVTAGALGDVGQYTLGAIPATALLGAAGRPRSGRRRQVARAGRDRPGQASARPSPVRAGDTSRRRARRLARGRRRWALAPVARSRPPRPDDAARAAADRRARNKRLLEYRHYSKDPLVKAVQVLMDRKLPDGAMIRDQHGRMVRAKVAAETRLASMLGHRRRAPAAQVRRPHRRPRQLRRARQPRADPARARPAVADPSPRAAAAPGRRSVPTSTASCARSHRGPCTFRPAPTGRSATWPPS